MPFPVILRATFALSAIVLIAGCSARAHCTGERPYQQAETVDALAEAEGESLPQSSGALVIPEEPVEGPSYAEGYEDDDGERRIRCLDDPPRMAPLGDDAA